MKIVILTFEHLYSNKIIKDLLKVFPNDIRLIIEPTEQLRGKTPIQTVGKYLKISGFYYVFHQSLRLVLYKAISFMYSLFGKDTRNKFYSYKKMAKGLKVEIRRVPDINSKEVINVLKRIGPDIIVSVLFSQIIKKEILDIPKIGAINFHPAYLPDYKGINPTFWAMANGEKYSGATVHRIDYGIDTGPIIKREKIIIETDDTEDRLYWKCVCVGSRLLVESIPDIYKKKIVPVKNNKGRYFSFPTKKAVCEFRERGRLFYRLKDLLVRYV